MPVSRPRSGLTAGTEGSTARFKKETEVANVNIGKFESTILITTAVSTAA